MYVDGYTLRALRMEERFMVNAWLYVRSRDALLLTICSSCPDAMFSRSLSDTKHYHVTLSNKKHNARGRFIRREHSITNNADMIEDLAELQKFVDECLQKIVVFDIITALRILQCCVLFLDDLSNRLVPGLYPDMSHPVVHWLQITLDDWNMTIEKLNRIVQSDGLLN